MQNLGAALESLGELVRQEMPNDANFAYPAIGQAAEYMNVVEVEKRLKKQEIIWGMTTRLPAKSE